MLSRLTITLSATLLAGALCVLPAAAQVRTAGQGIASPQVRSAAQGFAPPRQGAGGVIKFGGRGRGRGERGKIVRRGGRRGYYGGYGYGYLPGYYPYDYPDGYEQEAPPPEQPPVVVEYPPQPPPPPAPPVESLLLEYKNGQWVRVPTGAQTPAGPLVSQPGSAQAPSPRRNVPAGQESSRPPAVLPSTILVFRDGHKEDVNKYVIEGNVIYASTNYWSTGSWTKKIPLSELNVPATLKINQQRGVKFKLPSGPNEVVIGF
jgi:hypothetical protein